MRKGLKDWALTVAAFALLLILAAIVGATGSGKAGNSTEPARSSTAGPGVADGTGENYIVVNIEGTALYLLASPDGDRVQAWPDGTNMTVVGPDEYVDGTQWKNVKDPDGNVGWVPGEYCFRWLPGSWVVR